MEAGSERRVGAVFFDLYGTLVELAPLAERCEKIAPGRGADLARRWRERQIEATWLRSLIGAWADFEQVTSEALATAVADLDVDASARAGTAGLGDAFNRLPARAGSTEVVDGLTSAGIAAGVLTNASDRMAAKTLANAGLSGRFDPVLSVDAVRTYKPSPAVYALACDATDLTPDRIGFVSANGWDVAGAGSFGFRVVWLSDGSGVLPAVGAPPPLVARIEDVPAIFA